MNNHRERRLLVQLALASALLLLTACATQPTSPGPAGTLPPAPPLPVEGATVYHIDQSQSQLRILVYRGGPLGDIGHNHVIVTSEIHGNIYLHDKLGRSGFALRIPLKSLRVDPVAARKQAGDGFESRVTDEDRAGTRRNMLGPDVLNAARYPTMTLRSINVEGPPWRPRITVRVTLHGRSHDYVVPTAIVRSDDRLVAIGALTLKQTHFGITPFSVLGGALQVKNKVKVRFRLAATPAQDSE